MLGPDLVLDGVLTDDNGEVQFDLPIPTDAYPGLYLETIGHDGLALTRDCAVEVGAFDRCHLHQDKDIDRKGIFIILAGFEKGPSRGTRGTSMETHHQSGTPGSASCPARTRAAGRRGGRVTFLSHFSVLE